MRKVLFSLFMVVLLLTFALPAFAATGLNAAEESIIAAAKESAATITMNDSQKAKYESMLAQVTAYFKQDDVNVTATDAATVVESIQSATTELPKDITHYSLTKNITSGTAVSNYVDTASKALKVKVTVQETTLLITDSSGKLIASSKNVVKQTGGNWIPFMALAGVMAIAVAGTVAFGLKRQPEISD